MRAADPARESEGNSGPFPQSDVTVKNIFISIFLFFKSSIIEYNVNGNIRIKFDHKSL